MGKEKGEGVGWRMGKGKGRGARLVGGWEREKGEGVGWLEDGEGKRERGGLVGGWGRKRERGWVGGWGRKRERGSVGWRMGKGKGRDGGGLEDCEGKLKIYLSQVTIITITAPASSLFLGRGF
jgi:hypothetical protein